MNDSRPTRFCARSWMVQVLFLLALTLAWPLSSSADQAQYFYDELGRLSAVVDGEGNVASYQYDRVGNLLSIIRGTNDPPIITNLTPELVDAGTTVTLVVTGSHFFSPAITTSNSDFTPIVLPGNTDTILSVEIAVPAATMFGTTTLTVTTPFGEDSATFTIQEVFTTVVGIVVDEDATPVEGAAVQIANGPSGLTESDGSFSIPNVSLALGDIQVSASAIIDDQEFFGMSAIFPPVPHGITDVGTVTISDFQFEYDLGEPLSQSDDDFDLVTFSQGFTFSFFGTTYTEVFVNSNGRLTFEFGDTDYTETVAEFNEQPGIAPFFDDLDPSEGGDVFVNQFPDRLVVTWSQIPEWADGGLNTIQATLFQDGRILVAYNGLTADDAIIGITPGDSPTLIESDFSADTPLSTTGATAIFEEFISSDPFDLDQRFLLFVPNHTGGFDVDIPSTPVT